MPADALSFREGSARDLSATFELSQRAIHHEAVRHDVAPPDRTLGDEEIAAAWGRQRGLLEFVDAQPGATTWVCEDTDELLGYARVVRFGAMEELTELMVAPGHQRRGIGRALLERVWPGDPSPELGRIAVAVGTPESLSLYTEFGVMPIGGHWHLWQPTASYLERRSLELDATEPGVNVLKPERALQEWRRLEPPALGHDRSALHEFFARDRACLATVDIAAGKATALCWISNTGEIGPAVGETPEHLIPVILAALDRVAKVHEPPELRVFCTTLSWWLMSRLRTLGFQVFWPAWVMCSVPLPGLDRYVPTMPPHLL